MNDQKKARLERLARQIAAILHDDIQREGSLKPNYMSPKFWAYIHREMQKLEEKENS